MRARSSETGSVHVVLAVVLILAIVGGVGYVAFNALTKRQAAEPVATVTTPPKTTTKDLGFDAWGVKVAVASDSSLYVAKALPLDGESSGTFDGYYVYDSTYDKECGYAKGTGSPTDPSIAAIYRVKASDTVDSFVSETPMTNREYYTQNPNSGRIVGDYVYVYEHPNGVDACADPSTAKGQAAGQVMGKASGAFYTAFKGIKAN